MMADASSSFPYPSRRERDRAFQLRDQVDCAYHEAIRAVSRFWTEETGTHLTEAFLLHAPIVYNGCHHHNWTGHGKISWKA
ncbi:unnamed protein product [Haemonchus placei]|uniref:Transposase n=1 Tax=Haemonchus placei TaxID=6290 RepID=A0A0N4VSN8_HAEPC|nr:unnamed protein product [Haemonchus placei]